MNRKEKQAYLSQYQRALREYKTLKSNLESTHSIDYNHVKSTVHKTLGAKIQEVDEAHERSHERSIEWYLKINELIGDDIILGYRFLLGYSLEEIAEVLNYSTTTVRRRIKDSLDRLDI